MLRVAVAGPYSASTEEERENNLDRLNRAAASLLEKGFVPVIGINAALPVLKKADKADYAASMQISLAAIDACDVLLLLAESPGANRERDEFVKKGKPVFHTLEEVENYRSSRLK